PAERGGKDQRCEAIECRLDREQGDVAPRAVQEGAEHRERSNTKDEAGGDEGERYPSWLAAAMHAALGPGTDRLDAGIETKQLTDDDPDENADQQHEWISGFERHLEADDDDEQPDRDPDAALQAVGDHPAECQADGGADDHRAGVQVRARTRDHAGSELFEAEDAHDEDGGATLLDLDGVGGEEVTLLYQGQHRDPDLAAC